MANIKSQIKRNRQNDKKRLRNRVFRGTARIAVRTARTNIDDGTPESKAALMEAISNLDRAAAHGVIHKNNAARRKSRLMKAFAKMVPVPVEALAAGGEPMPAAEPAPKKKASSRRTSRKVEEPVASAAEAVDETKVSKAKKTAAAPKAKKTDAKKPAAKTTAKKKSAATKES